MSTYELLLIGHLVGVFLLVGAAGLSTATGIAAGRAATAGTVVTLLNLQVVAERVVTSAGAVITVIFGILLIDEAGFEFSDPWISAAFTLIIVMLAIDHGVLMRQNKKAREAAAKQATDAPVSSEVSGILGSPLTIGAGILLDLSLLVFLYLMVAKPGA